MPRVYAHINPAMLVWARKQRGFDIETAADKIGISADRLLTCETAPRLSYTSTNQDHSLKLSIPQLRKVSQVYRVPMALFYLRQPPTKRKKIPDFRRRPENIGEPYSPGLRLEIRKAEEKRQAAALHAEYGPAYNWSWVGSVALTDDPEMIGQRIRQMLAVNTDLQHTWAHDSYASFNGWRLAMENIGVLVFQFLGIDLIETRGFCLAQQPYPILAVSRNDLPHTRCFSLLHEFCHLLLGESGLFDLSNTACLSTDRSDSIERFCNHAAAAALIPAELLNQTDELRDRPEQDEWLESDLQSLANRFSVSVDTVIRRLIVLGHTTQGFYNQLREKCAYQPKPVNPASQIPEKGFLKVIRTHGTNYPKLILAALGNHAMSASSATEYLDMKMKHLSQLEQALLPTSEAES